MPRFKRSTRIQSVIIPRRKGLSVQKAKSELKGAGFHYFKIDVKPHQYRFRQESPMHFNPKTFRTISLGKDNYGGMKAVIGVPKYGY